MRIFVREKHYSVHVSGSGEPLMLLHGFTGDKSNWKDLALKWAETYQVITLDLLGHGKTDGPPDEEVYGIEEAAADLAALMDKLELNQLFLLGYSMGGRLALAFSVLYPEKVKGLILESSSPGLRTAKERLDRMKSDQQLASFLMKEGVEAFVDKWEKVPLFQSQLSLPLDIQEKIRKQRLENRALGLANSLLGMGTGRQPSYWDDLHQLHFPVLLICGELDEKFCKIGVAMDNELPQSKLVMVEDVGHAIHVEDPLKFGTIVEEFLHDVLGQA